ncbi:MAG: endonuclease/exonuclease/phosphatase family protein [Planctomycetota bacterium]
MAGLALGAPLLRAADPPRTEPGTLRIATYNVAMYRRAAGELAAELSTGASRQAKRIAEVLQRVRPDIVLLNEIDHVSADDASASDPVALFAERYLAAPQAPGLEPLDLPHRFAAPVNTGEPSGLDLDGDGSTDGPADAWGYGAYPGVYGMAVLSRLPIDAAVSRSFRKLRWADLPNARRPIVPATGEPFYPSDVWRRLRLPSKTLVDVVVRVGDRPLHLVGSHPTPPVFDGPEDRNGARNADEIRLVREYVTGELAEYFVDDAGRAGSLAVGARYVVLGDLNADPNDGNGRPEAIRRLLAVTGDPAPRSAGGVKASRAFAQLNGAHTGDPGMDTGAFGPDGHGNLRIDYALPCPELRVVRTGVYWPIDDEPGADAVTASDHRMVWVDIESP